jgi:hypothetical protein
MKDLERKFNIKTNIDNDVAKEFNTFCLKNGMSSNYIIESMVKKFMEGVNHTMGNNTAVRNIVDIGTITNNITPVEEDLRDIQLSSVVVTSRIILKTGVEISIGIDNDEYECDIVNFIYVSNEKTLYLIIPETFIKDDTEIFTKKFTEEIKLYIDNIIVRFGGELIVVNETTDMTDDEMFEMLSHVGIIRQSNDNESTPE